MKNALQAKCEARNLVALEHNRLLPILAAAFAPLVGKKLLKVDGDILEKYANLAPKSPASTRELMVYRHRSNYSLAFTVKACVVYGEFGTGCTYAEATVYVGNLNGQVLESLIAPQPLPANYTPEKVLAARAEVNAAREALRRAESKLGDFGDFDR